MLKKLLLVLIMISTLNGASVPEDKFKHAFVGFSIYGLCLFGGVILDEFDYDHPLDGATCLVPVFIAGAGKEIYDANNDGHTAEFADFAATVAIPVGLSFVIYEW